jgi:hypothetical protein
MSFPTARRSYDYSYSDDSENNYVQKNGGSSGATGNEVAKTTSGSATTTTANTTTTTTTQIAPVMVSRDHLLHNCPSDVRFYFASKYIADENASPKEQAINLRQYAGISKSHHLDVIDVLNRRPDVSLVSTRNALPTLATFAKGEKERKLRFDMASKELFQTYRHVQANLSTSDLQDNKNTTCFSQGLRKIALENLLANESVKEFILDVSHDPYKFSSHKMSNHINLWSGEINESEARLSKNRNKKNSQWKSELNERKKLSDALCKSLKTFSKSEDRSSVSFSLKCLNQPFKTFLAPLAQTLADCKAGLDAIKSLDLGFSFLVSGYESEHTKTDDGMVLMATYTNNLAFFITSNINLKHLSLRRNGLNSQMLMPVVKALRQNVDLESLDLSKNYLPMFSGNSDSIITVLVDAFDGMPSLRHVNLAGCGLTESSADLLWIFLTCHPEVTICIAENMMILPSHRIHKLDNIETEHSDVDYSSS